MALVCVGHIHVTDLAKGHIKALERIADKPGAEIYNLGTNRGFSVLNWYKLLKSHGKPIPYQIVDRRPGDIAVSYADASKANQHLHWRCEKSIADARGINWRWQSNNPNGFE